MIICMKKAIDKFMQHLINPDEPIIFCSLEDERKSPRFLLSSKYFLSKIIVTNSLRDLAILHYQNWKSGNQIFDIING